MVGSLTKKESLGVFHFGSENKMMKWNDAKKFCNGLRQNSKLVEHCSKDMIDAIGAIFPYESPIAEGYPGGYTGLGWVGVYQDAGSKPWKWASTGSALTPEDVDWREGEPNHHTENCVEMVKTTPSRSRSSRVGQWNNLPCWAKRYPICHYPCNAAT